MPDLDVGMEIKDVLGGAVLTITINKLEEAHLRKLGAACLDRADRLELARRAEGNGPHG